MTCFKVERALQKLVPRVVVLALLALWRMMRVVGAAIQVGADASPDVVETV